MNNWRQILSWANPDDNSSWIFRDTQDAYSFDRYGEENWRKVIDLLLSWDLNTEGVEEVLRSKYMRWIGDDADIDADIMGYGSDLDDAFERKLLPVFQKRKQSILKFVTEALTENERFYNTRYKKE